MYDIRLTESFAEWLSKLRDHRSKARIVARLKSARLGNFGDTRSIGDGVSEMRIDVGPGCRLYFTLRRDVIIVMLCGGDKSTQSRDIARAKA